MLEVHLQWQNDLYVSHFACNECHILVEVIVCHNGVKMGSDLLTSHKYCGSKDHKKEKDCSWWVGGRQQQLTKH